MSRKVEPGNWANMVVVMDNIPIRCPECGHDVSLQGDIDIEKGEFQVTSCPHCGVRMELTITTESEEGEEQAEEGNPLEKMEVSIGVKGLPGLSECLYRISGMSTVSGTIDRVVNVLSTIFANQDINPNAIKNLYVREIISSFYTPDGKKSLIEELEAQIEEKNG